ncbi:hypothetical protein F4808DRAFT_410326 [Astrocystis sublimbata]|nr:hypothetical protein F4808DRAFT_410326 [Astrocystis sublimbata]
MKSAERARLVWFFLCVKCGFACPWLRLIVVEYGAFGGNKRYRCVTMHPSLRVQGCSMIMCKSVDAHRSAPNLRQMRHCIHFLARIGTAYTSIIIIRFYRHTQKMYS